jgi:protein-arginine deiminase
VQKFDYYDTWTQDFFEPAHSSMPGPDGPVVIRIMIRSFQQRDSGAQVFTDLRTSGVGVVQQLSPGTTDSTGNLEAIPPYTYQGKSYPAGRVIMGSQQGQLPFIFEFLQAQETQDPIGLNTSWLAVGHVDEFVQFLPAPHAERGWVMMADDPLAGLELLNKVVEEGHCDQKAYSRPRLPTDDPSWPLNNVTLKEHLNKPNFTAQNELAAERIQHNIDIIKDQTGITDDEIFRVPSAFYRVELFDFVDGVSPFQAGSVRNKLPQVVHAAAIHNKLLRRRQQSKDPWLLSSWPSIINGVILSDSYYLAPKPWGPIVDGKDVLEEAATKVYAAAANYSISFMDDWFSHHMGGGEIHCGSNVWRKADAPWW